MTGSSMQELLTTTKALAVSNRHIVLATSAYHELAAPFTGTFSGPPVASHLMYDIALTAVASSGAQSQQQR
jgi:hypothetical protein